MKTPSTQERARKPRKRRRRSFATQMPGKNARELWALLSNADARTLFFASRRLDRISTSGVRHFSAVGRAVPLQQAAEVIQEIHILERTADPCEVALMRPTRQWQRRARVVDVDVDVDMDMDMDMDKW